VVLAAYSTSLLIFYPPTTASLVPSPSRSHGDGDGREKGLGVPSCRIGPADFAAIGLVGQSYQVSRDVAA
jgi:hypothetical protein